MLYTFDANGSVGVIQEWVQNGLAETPEEIELNLAAKELLARRKKA